MAKQFTVKRVLALILAIALCAGAFAGCGGSVNGIPNGKYEPADGSGSFTYLDFKGGKVEIGSGYAGTTVSSESVKYTFKNGKLSFSVGGVPFDMPCTVNGDTLTIGGIDYVKGGAKAATTPKADVSVAESPIQSVDSVESEPTAGGTTKFDGVYNSVSYGYTSTLTIENGEYELTGPGIKDSGIVAEDGSFEATVAYSNYSFVVDHDSYVSHGSEFIKEGGKSLFEYAIEEQTADLPDITLEYYAKSNVQIGDISNLPESDIFGRAKYLYRTDSYSDDNKTFFVITNNNELWSWGNNQYGQLGDGSGVDRSEPVKIMDNIAGLRSYGDYIIAFGTDGKVWHWGDAELYIIFAHEKDNIYEPKLVAEGVADIYNMVEKKAALILKSNGDLLLQSNKYLTSTNEPVPSLTLLHKVKRVYPSKDGPDAFVVLSDNSLYHYPNLFKQYNQLEMTMAEREKLYDNADIYTFYYDDEQDVWYVDTSEPLIVITDSGELWGKGENSNGQLGDGTKIDREDWIKIADGVKSYTLNNESYNYYCSYEKLDGSVWTWTSDDPTPKEAIPAGGIVEPASDPEEDAPADGE
jgi:hypothetical protein